MEIFAWQAVRLEVLRLIILFTLVEMAKVDIT